MERHERYDPEDIESLLSERAFDELLADERAFVLRHLSGREEYERMRALLHYVRPDERERGTIEPEERVKRNVMAAFRAQQQPQWRIWLNTLATWLAPGDAAAMWRPALALGSLALLIVGGVVAVRQFDGASQNAMVAELKKEEAHMPAAPGSMHTERVAEPSTSAEAAKTTMTELDRPTAAANEREQLDHRVQPPIAEASKEGIALFDARKTAEAEATTADFADAAPVLEETKFTPAASAGGSNVVETLSHMVTADELARNMSTTNATGMVTAKDVATTRASEKRMVAFDQRSAASRSVAQDPKILELVTAGW